MTVKKKIKNIFADISKPNIVLILVGSFIVSFGLYNIHDAADITEGGILGLDLLLEHHFSISPAITNFILTAICFFIGIKALGKSFIVYSAISCSSFSFFYFLIEKTPRLFPEIALHPFAAAVFGAVFVGVGVGLTVSSGGAQSGDDALAMALNRFFGIKISTVYLVSDIIVLLLSLTYIPIRKIFYSLITVILSGQIIEIMIKVKTWLSKKK